jgi:hypothetical protein
MATGRTRLRTAGAGWVEKAEGWAGVTGKTAVSASRVGPPVYADWKGACLIGRAAVKCGSVSPRHSLPHQIVKELAGIPKQMTISL